MTGPRYADRFLPERGDRSAGHRAPSGTPTHDHLLTDGADRADRGERVARGAGDRAGDDIAGGPRRTLPPWLLRVGAGIGVAGAAAIVIGLGSDGSGDTDTDDAGAAPQPTSEEPRETAIPYREAIMPPLPVMAAIEVDEVGAELWASRGFSYDVSIENPTAETFEIVDVGPPISGTEIAWDRELVLEPGGTATYRIDYLVVNCLAATTGSVPDELRLLVRRGGESGPVELELVETSGPAAFIKAAGRDICSASGDNFGSSFS